MRWLFFLLLLVNFGLAAYVYLQHTRPHPDAQIMALQMNADQIRVVAEPPRPAPRPPRRTACLEWGTFGDLELRRVRAAIAPLGLGDRVSETRRMVTARWWIYMPPQGSRSRMQRKAEELVQLGISDFEQVLDEGRWQYAISLGAFREEKSARDYFAELRKEGLRTGDIGRREQQVEQTTLVIRAPTPAESTQLVELATQFSGSEMRATQCEN